MTRSMAPGQILHIRSRPASTKADARAIAALARAARQRATNRNVTAPRLLWAITVAMIALLAATALIVMFD